MYVAGQFEERLSLRAPFVACALAVLTRKRPSIIIIIFVFTGSTCEFCWHRLAPCAGGTFFTKKKSLSVWLHRRDNTSFLSWCEKAIFL